MRRLLLIIGLLLIPFIVSGFPSIDDETSFIDSMRETSENDIQNPRALGRSYRKASEDKHPWQGTFPEMELIAWPGLDGAPRPIDIPKVITPDLDPKISNRPDYAVGDRGGCFLVGPAVWNFFGDTGMNSIKEAFRYWLWDMTSNGMILTDVDLSGPAKITQVGGSGIWLPIWIKAYENITKKVPVRLTAKGTSFYDIGNGPVSYDIICSGETIIYPTTAECDCIGTTPTIVDDDADDVIASAGSVNVWVNSGGLACPPYTWSVSGEGWSLSANETENDLETTTLSLINTAGKTCGTGGSGQYDVYATVTVTDNCGVTDTQVFRFSGGTWDSRGSDSWSCVPFGCSTSGCTYSCSGLIYKIIDNKRWTLFPNTCRTNATKAYYTGCIGYDGICEYPPGTDTPNEVAVWGGACSSCSGTTCGPLTNYIYSTWECP